MLRSALLAATTALLGLPAIGVLVFEIALGAGALWTHTRVALPSALERVTRWLLITPSLHRVHHHTDAHDQQHNFGTLLSIWDLLFRSARFASTNKSHCW